MKKRYYVFTEKKDTLMFYSGGHRTKKEAISMARFLNKGANEYPIILQGVEWRKKKNKEVKE